MSDGVLESGTVRLAPSIDPVTSLMALHRIHGKLTPIRAFTRTNPKQIPDTARRTPHSIQWITDRDVDQAIRPTLENLFSIIERTIQEGRGILWQEGVELLVRTNGFESVLKFVRGVVDLCRTSEWTVIIVGAPGTMSDSEWARLRREAPTLTIGDTDIIESESIDDSKEETEIGIQSDGPVKDVPPMLARLPPESMDYPSLLRRAEAWASFGFDVASLIDAISVDIDLAREVYERIEQDIRTATECLVRIEDAEYISSPLRMKMRFRCMQLTGIEEIASELDRIEEENLSNIK